MPDSTAPAGEQHTTAVIYRTVLGASRDDGWWRIQIEGVSEEVWPYFMGFYWKPGESVLRVGSWTIFDLDGAAPRFSEEIPLREPHLESVFHSVWEYLEPRFRAAQNAAGSGS
jgi:hypothetical protein